MAFELKTVGGILAGGEASRLGPLGLQLNKALVPIGQRPIVAHQLNQLRDAGVRNVTVLVQEHWSSQVTQALARSHPRAPAVEVLPEPVPVGPGPALGTLAEAARGRPLLVFLADTWVDALDAGNAEHGDWVGVAPAPADRVWCVPGDGGFTETWAARGTPVAVGVYRFSDPGLLTRSARAAREAGEKTLSATLRRYSEERPMSLVDVSSWCDIGTLGALRDADRIRIRHREGNSFSITPRGDVVKRGTGPDFAAEIGFMRDLDPVRKRYFPAVVETGPAHYTTELVELPTLAYLYLYWPPGHQVWTSVLANLITTLETDFWPVTTSVRPDDVAARARALYVGKPRTRMRQWGGPLAEREALVVNGVKLVAGEALLDAIEPALARLASEPTPAFLHGDLNFGNILYGLSTGRFKLLDPRGDCGGRGPLGDLRYDLAKLRYSYRDGFSAICDGLFQVEASGTEIRLDLPDHDDAAARACDDVLAERADLDELALVEASILLSAAPLHADDPRQQVALYARGVQVANEALGW